MPGKKREPKKHVEYHKDGTVWAKGRKSNGKLTGYWEWFRKDGTRMRSGYFENGEQVGKWTTYDKTGAVYKVTMIKPKPVNCELTTDPKARRAADIRTAKIAPAFPPGIPRPALRALDAAGYKRLSQLKSVSDAELLALHGMGPKALGILRGV